MISLFYIYDSSGRILRTGACPNDHVSLQAGAGETAVAGSADDAVQYYDTGASSLADRPANPTTIDKTTVASDGTDMVVLTGVPPSSTVSVTGPMSTSTIVNDGVLQLTFDTPGEYVVRVESFPELNKEFVINAT